MSAVTSSFTLQSFTLMEHVMNPDRTKSHESFAGVCLLVLVVTGLVGTSEARSATKVPSGDPCTVVPLPDVKKAFPGAKPGARSKRLEKDGMTECAWNDSSGVALFGVQEFYGSSSAMDELKPFALAMVNFNMSNARNLRYEILKGVGLGNDAVAFVEAIDAKRGIVSEGAMLVLHRGERTLYLSSPALPPRNRAEALKTLEILGKIAAKRLD
jgi:hypothetical protein